MKRRHLTEDQKAVLVNNFREILSKKRETKAGKKAINTRWYPEREYDEETVSPSYEEEGSRKIAAKRWKVSEWRFLPISETVSENGNDRQGSLTYSKNISNY